MTGCGAGEVKELLFWLTMFGISMWMLSIEMRRHGK